MDENELMIYGEIGGWSSLTDVAVIAALESMKDSKKISIRINSPGGDAFMGVSIMNALKRHKAKVTAHIDALAASAASIVAMGADKIVMHEGSMMMIHRAWTYTGGNAQDMLNTADVLGKVDSQLVGIYEKKSGLDAAKVKQLLDAETWMTSKEAFEYGFADEAVSEPVTTQAKVPEKWFSHVPESVSRYALENRIAACCGVKIGRKQSPQDKEDERLKASLRRLTAR